MSAELTGKIDLHTHTSCSDGTLTPLELLESAHESNVSVLAITDHDTVAAYGEPGLKGAAEQLGVRLIPGVEISTADSCDNRFHVLGLDIDTASVELQSWLQKLLSQRKIYARQVTDLLLEGDWQVDVDGLLARDVVSKAHIADDILQAPYNRARLATLFGTVPNRGKFIEAMLNQGKQYYVPRESGPTPQDAVEIIHSAGGAAILAHPVACLYEQSLSVDDIADCVTSNGFDGLEATYYYYSKSLGDRKVNRVRQFSLLAKQLGVITTGGSDFHGDSESVGRTTALGMVGEQGSMTKEQLLILELVTARYK